KLPTKSLFVQTALSWIFVRLWLLPISHGFQPPSVLATFRRSRIPGRSRDNSSCGNIACIHRKRHAIEFIERLRAIAVLNESNCVDRSEILHPSLKVGIVGAGSIAFGTASLLSSLGHDPMLWSPSGAGTKDFKDPESPEQNSSGISVRYKIQSTGALDRNFDVRIARSPCELVASNDNVLVIALPVNGHKQVMESIAPEIVKHVMDQRIAQRKTENEPSQDLKPVMHIIISSHASLGAVYLMNLLAEEYRRYLSANNIFSDLGVMDWVRITSWGTTAITARKLSGTSVKVLTVRQSIDFCTVPSSPFDDPEEASRQESVNPENDFLGLLSDGYRLCNCLFGSRFKHRKGGLLAISLSNLNPQNHLGIVLGNMSRMDPPPPPPPIDPQTPTPDIVIEPWYQGKCITPNVGRLMEALDRERIEIANALDIQVRTIYQHFSWSFHVPLETAISDDNHASTSAAAAKTRPLTVSEMNQQMHYYVGNDVLGPAVPDSRYVLEDVPYGLVLIVILGRLVNRPATLHEAGIMIVSAMYGRDFMNENELLQGLGLTGEGHNIPHLSEWKEMAYTGCFKCGAVSRSTSDEDMPSLAESK
ncbi:hypothetical protein ACHAW6_014448, partial [Cyclotella cf. meneghiniana]